MTRQNEIAFSRRRAIRTIPGFVSAFAIVPTATGEDAVSWAEHRTIVP
jgi:hypothetical protein